MGIGSSFAPRSDHIFTIRYTFGLQNIGNVLTGFKAVTKSAIIC